jgi:hypothetical protein
MNALSRAALLCVVSGTAPAKGAGQQLEVRLTLESTHYVRGEPIYAVVELVNSGLTPVDVPREFDAGSGFLRLHLVAADGRDLREHGMRADLFVGGPSWGDTLQAGESQFLVTVVQYHWADPRGDNRLEPLTQLADLAPGSYTLRADYRWRDPRLMWLRYTGESSAEVPVVRASSTAVQFSIRPRSPSDEAAYRSMIDVIRNMRSREVPVRAAVWAIREMHRANPDSKWLVHAATAARATIWLQAGRLDAPEMLEFDDAIAPLLLEATASGVRKTAALATIWASRSTVARDAIARHTGDMSTPSGRAQRFILQRARSHLLRDSAVVRQPR